MKLVVLVPSEAYKSYAGVRIRYKRIAPELGRHAVELALTDIGQFDPTTADCDGIIISKCHDARSLIAAAALRQRGKLVGVDLFDDYFSQPHDARLTRLRNWLAQLVDLCDFALCSTGAMAEVVRNYRSSLLTHIMHDPAPAESFDLIASALERKVANASDRREIRVCWFGVGDNHLFPVGLTDLLAHASVLPALSRAGFDLRLKVVTNTRALTADGLSMLGCLPVRTEIEEWSEDAETNALQEALIAFLPVGTQQFSIAKSLNRAMTALSAGCQVLSVGYPLYDRLESLIYRSAETLLNDLELGSLRFSVASLGKFRRIVDTCASAGNEAVSLARFLQALEPQPQSNAGPLCLIHGQSTRQEAHNLIRQVGGLSVASPYYSTATDFDVLFRGARSGLKMLVAQSVASRLLPQVRARAKRRERLNGRRYLQIYAAGTPNGQAPEWLDWENAPIPFQLATYGQSLELMQRALNAAFGPCRTLVSEMSPLPFPLAGQES
jgi:hypothetical protein